MLSYSRHHRPFSKSLYPSIRHKSTRPTFEYWPKPSNPPSHTPPPPPASKPDPKSTPLFQFRSKPSPKSSKPGDEKPGEAQPGNAKTGWTTLQIGLAVGAVGAFAFTTGKAYQKARDLKADYADEGKFGGVVFAGGAGLDKAVIELSELLGPDGISQEEETIKFHGYSEWSPANIDTLPVAVVYPKSTEEVSRIAKVCHKHRVPMIGYSGGSSLEGNFSAPHSGIVIDFQHMDKVLTLHAEDMDVVLQPSVNWVDLNKQLVSHNLFFPVDPSPSARIGGMVGTNCSGTNAVRYGTMKDWVLNLTVVLADGTIIKTKGGRPRKSSAGYNLNSVFVGAEGTLGLVTEITLKLAAIPPETSVAVVTFPTIRQAARTATAILGAGVPIACLEFLDATQMDVLNKGGYTAPKVWKELPTLFLKFSGTSKAGIAEDIKTVQRIAKTNGGGSFEFARDKGEQELIWSGRKQALWSLLAVRPEGTELWTTDIAVPVSRLADIIEESTAGLKELGLFSSIVGHLGDGNFHEAIMYHRDDPVETAAVQAHVKKMMRSALKMEGTCTGEHSVGFFKKEELLQEAGPDTIFVMKSLKKALDPHWLMNPGKIFDTPKQI